MFHGLSQDNLKAIVDIQIANIKKRLKNKELDLQVSDSAKEKLAEIGYDPVFGARPLKRVIQKYLIDELSKMILSGIIQVNDIIQVNVDKKGQLIKEWQSTR